MRPRLPLSRFLSLVFNHCMPNHCTPCATRHVSAYLEFTAYRRLLSAGCLLPLAAGLLSSAFCLNPTFGLASGLPQAGLIYQWNFNGDGTGTTVTPSVYPQSSPDDPASGVLTMSQIHVNSDFSLSDPVATNLYSPAGTGVFYNAVTNPNDRAFNNSGTIYNPQNGNPGDVAGMLSSNNASFFTPSPGSTLSASAGTHTQITLTTWVKLDATALTASPFEQPRLISLGLPVGGSPYDGQFGSGVTGMYLGFYTDGASHKDTLQFTTNGAAGASNTGLLGPTNMVDAISPSTGNPYKSDWMFLAVTEDSAAPQGAGTVANVQFYLGDKTDSLGAPVLSSTLPNNSFDASSPGPINLNNNSVYIGNRVSGPMNRGLGALIDDTRIYDGVLDSFQLDRVRQNLALPVPGDFNLDGSVTVADVPAMLGALADLNDYQTANQIPTADLLGLGDLDGDGAITNSDVQALISQLANTAAASGQSSLVSVPEPAAWLAMATGGMGFFFARRKRLAVAH